MLKMPFLRRFAIGFTVVLGSVIAHDTLWDAMFREHLRCEVHHCLATQWESCAQLEFASNIKSLSSDHARRRKNRSFPTICHGDSLFHVVGVSHLVVNTGALGMLHITALLGRCHCSCLSRIHSF